MNEDEKIKTILSQRLINLLRENFDKPQNWGKLSNRNDITIDFIRENIDKPWDWEILSKRNDIIIDFIRENIDKPWNWKKLVATKI